MHRLLVGKVGLIAFVLFLTMFTMGIHSQAYAKNISIYVNNQEIVTDSVPAVIDGRTYVPLRIISENLGAKVEWKAATRQVVINWKTSDTLILPPARAGEVQIVIDGQTLLIPSTYGTPYINSYSRTMIPLRAVAEALDCQVNWLAEAYSVDIRSNPQTDEDKLLSELARYQTNLKLLDGTYINSIQLLGKDADSFSAAQIESFKSYLDELDEYPLTMDLPDGSRTNISDITIMGTSDLTAAQLKEWIERETPRIKSNMAAKGIRFQPIPDLAEIYINIGSKYGLRGDIAFCQAAKETGYWQFTGQVQAWQNNYCGLSATGAPMTGTESLRGADPSKVSFLQGFHGAIFTTPAVGVEAHIQHLYAYATKEDLPAGMNMLDPRYTLVTNSSAQQAPRWVDLNSRWAVPGTTYGQSILSDYWSKAVAAARS